MEDYNPNPDNQGVDNNQGKDGANANQGGDNSQDQGNQSHNQDSSNANQGAGNGNQAGDDYQKKFSESTREAQRLLDVLKQNGIDPKTGKKAEAGDDNNDAGDSYNQGQGNDASDTFFSDDELAATFPSYATMTDQEKAVLKQVGSFPKMARMVAEMHDKLTFSEQLEVLKTDPANELIAKNEKEFKAFAYKGDNLKIPLEVLKDAFIGQKLREQGSNANQQAQGNDKGNQQRQGMEDGSAGAGKGNASQEMTAEQVRDLRQKDPRKYNKLARAGKIKIV